MIKKINLNFVCQRCRTGFHLESLVLCQPCHLPTNSSISPILIQLLCHHTDDHIRTALYWVPGFWPRGYCGFYLCSTSRWTGLCGAEKFWRFAFAFIDPSVKLGVFSCLQETQHSYYFSLPFKCLWPLAHDLIYLTTHLLCMTFAFLCHYA